MIGIKDVRCLTCRQTVEKEIESARINTVVIKECGGRVIFLCERGKEKARTSHEERKKKYRI